MGRSNSESRSWDGDLDDPLGEGVPPEGVTMSLKEIKSTASPILAVYEGGNRMHSFGYTFLL